MPSPRPLLALSSIAIVCALSSCADDPVNPPPRAVVSIVGTAVGFNGTIIRTENGGKTWQAQTSGTTETLGDIVFPTPATGTAVGAKGTILRTTNGGIAWTPQTSPRNIYLTGVSFVGPNHGWIVAGLAVLRTTNGGGDWTAKDVASFELEAVSFAHVNVGTVVGFVAQNFGQEGIFRSSDGGSTWIEQTNVVDGVDLKDVCFPDTLNGFAVGVTGAGHSPIIRTQNGGNSWTLQTSGTAEGLYGVSFVNAQTGTAVGTAGTILRTVDGGNTWTPQASGTSDDLFGVAFIDSLTGTVVGENGTILHTTDGGSTWVGQPSGVSVLLHSVSLITKTETP